MNFFSWVLSKGSIPDVPIMYSMRLFKTERLGIDLHKIVHADAPDCFHTHPYKAIRIVLWGGYIEQLESGSRKLWSPGAFGMIAPDTCHRIDALIKGPSYSLWIKFRATHSISLVGSGWEKYR